MGAAILHRCTAAAAALVLGACASLPFDKDSMGYSHPITPNFLGGSALGAVTAPQTSALAPQAERIAALEREVQIARVERARYAQQVVVEPRVPNFKRAVVEVNPLPTTSVRWDGGGEPRVTKPVTRSHSSPRPRSANASRPRVSVCSWRDQGGQVVGSKCP